MKLKFRGTVQNEHVMSAEAGTVSDIDLRQGEPRLTMTVDELKAACPSVDRASVFTVTVTDSFGRESRVHFSVGLTHQGRVKGEVLAVRTNDDVRATATATWFKPLAKLATS